MTPIDGPVDGADERRVVVVTGAARGIGLAVSRRLAARGGLVARGRSSPTCSTPHRWTG